MNRTDKESFVSELRERVRKAPVVYLTDFTGLDVKSITQLRRSLKASGAEYVVVKNRLAKLAFDETELPNIFEDLTGPTGVVLGYDDAVAPAKTLKDFAKEHDSKPAFKLGILDQKVLHPEQIDRLAKLPSREVLLAQLAGLLEAPLAQLAAALEGKLQEMAGLLEALKEERSQAGG
jgi:large subunit ribosomal protein L10